LDDELTYGGVGFGKLVRQDQALFFKASKKFLVCYVVYREEISSDLRADLRNGLLEG
jgi:hypothetical protein